MEQEQWEQQNKPMARGGGSVKRARERAAREGESSIPLPSRPSPPRAIAAGTSVPMNRIQPPMPPVLGSRGGQPMAGVAISRPIQTPQWPLGGTMDGGPYLGDDRQLPPQARGPDPRSNPQYSPPKNRGPAPKRPPRPSQVPEIPENQTAFISTQSGKYNPGMPSPEIGSPMTQSSGRSILSSVGSIPDFPTPAPPALPQPARKIVHLGPPPSSRRGASSYYSQASFVSPIPEESPRPSHQSYASSAAIPSSWGSRSPQYDYSDDEGEYEDEDVHQYSPYQNGTMDEVRGDSRGSNGDDSDNRGLIRSASFGRRAKPAMIITRSSGSIEPIRPAATVQQSMQHERNDIGLGLAPPTSVAGQRDTIWPGGELNPLASGTGLIDASVSSSETVPTIGAAVTINEPAPTYTPQPADPKNNAMLGAYNQASGLSPGAVLPLRQPSPLRTPITGFSGLSALRRPLRLDIDAVRDAEARGSLTSLPDLIARATRLASLMDRGKRPSSRMILNDWGEVDKEMGIIRDEKHKSGLSGMLAAFPPPGIQTPRDGTPTRPSSAWPSGYGPSNSQDDEKRAPRRRRCCGLPLWGFFILVLILLIIIAAAIVVPLEFLVFNKKTTTTALTPLEKCSTTTSTQCQNGGTSTVSGSSCACICTNGFTGSTCTVANATGCATTTLDGVDGNVTLGDAIARLIEGSGNYSVPLTGESVVAKFNANDLSCATENALVTFDGRSGRVGSAGDLVKGTTTSAASSMATATAAARRRGRDVTVSSYPTSTESSESSVATASSGILYDSSDPPSSTTASAASATASVDPSANFQVTEETLDFARVAVLYILQEGTLNAAITAQSTIEKFFELESFTNRAAMNVSLGTGSWVDLLGFRVDTGTGEGVVGGVNDSVVERRGVVGGSVGGLEGRSKVLWSV